MSRRPASALSREWAEKICLINNRQVTPQFNDHPSNASVEDKRASKAAVFAQMRAEYAALKVQWGGSAGYDAWFAQGPTNASLAAAALYSRKVPEFRALFIAEGGNLPRFYARVQELARMPKEQRNRELANAGMPPVPGQAARAVTP